jgi:hypothetical protein
MAIRNADSMSRQRCAHEKGPPSHPRRSGPSAPVFNAVMIGCEAVADAPQNRVRAAGNVDLAIDRSDVGLHRVRAEVGQRCHLSVAMALGDERQFSDSRSVSPSLRPGQFSAPVLRARKGESLITMSPAWIAFKAGLGGPHPLPRHARTRVTITPDQRRGQKRALRGSAVQRWLPSARAAWSVAASMSVKVPVSILSINGPANRPSGPPLGT